MLGIKFVLLLCQITLKNNIRGGPSAVADAGIMVEMWLDARIDKVRELRRLISEVEAETHRNRGSRPVPVTD